MKRLAVAKAFLPLLVAGWTAGLGVAQAGDPIILPADQGKAPPVPQAPSSKQVLKPSQRLPKVDPLRIEGLSLPTPSGRRKKTEEEKRRQAARDERRNWLLLRPGELTDKATDERSFGVRLDKWAADEEPDRRDYTFYGMDRAKADGQGEPKPGHNRQSTGQTPTPAARPAEPEDRDKPLGTAGSPLLLFDQGRSGQGAHMAKELDLRGYLDTTIVDLQSGNSSSMGGEGLLRGGPGERSRQAQARLDEFKELLKAPKGPAWIGEPAPPTQPSADLARPPVVSTPSLPESGLGRGGASPLTAPSDLGGAGLSRSLAVPGLPDLQSGRLSAPSRLPAAPPAREPMAGPPISRPSVMRPTVLEIPSIR